MKQCNRCKVDKEDNQFIHGRNKCLDCYRKRQEYYRNNRERELARAKRNNNKDRNHTNEVKRAGIRKNPVSYILWQIKSKSKRYNIPFNLTHEDIVIPTHCPVLGIPLTISDGNSTWNSPSVDRTIPRLGYVKGNIAIISHRANSIKSDATSKELEMVLNYVRKMQG